MTFYQTQKVEVVLSTEIQDFVSGSATKADKIRFLYANGFKKGTIAQILDIRYQHVRNTLLRPLKKSN